MNRPTSPLSDIERSIADKYSRVNFPPATAAKRLARNLGSGYIQNLSDKGRAFLAYCVHRYRRQIVLSSEEAAWVKAWLEWQEPEPPLPRSLMRLVDSK